MADRAMVMQWSNFTSGTGHPSVSCTALLEQGGQTLYGVTAEDTSDSPWDQLEWKFRVRDAVIQAAQDQQSTEVDAVVFPDLSILLASDTLE